MQSPAHVQHLFARSTPPAPPPPAPPGPVQTDSKPDVLDIDDAELIQLYRRIPPPDLRAFALTRTRDKMIADVVRRTKEDGIFDTFRKAWLKDLETKPAFQNLIRRVEIRCAEFMRTFKWTPELNKNHTRERLQRFIDNLSFVDVGIKNLLQEIHTEFYANPIPFHRFEDSVTRIVGEIVQRCIQQAMPPFPRLRKPGEPDDEPPLQPAPSFHPASSMYSAPPPPIMARLEEPKHKSRTSRSKSPDIVDMEISSPEGSDTDLSEITLPQEDLPRRPVTPVPPPPVQVEATNDRDEAALVLLMLAGSGGGKEWEFSGSQSGKTEGSDISDQVSPRVDPPPPPPPPLEAKSPSKNIPPPPPGLPKKASKVLKEDDLLVKTEPVSAESSPRADDSEKPKASDKTTHLLETLFDTIDSESEEEKPVRISKPRKAEAYQSAAAHGAKMESIMVQPKVESGTRSDSPKISATQPMFQSRITKMETISVGPGKTAKKAATQKAGSSQGKPAKRNAEGKPKTQREFVPEISDFTYPKPASAEEGRKAELRLSAEKTEIVPIVKRLETESVEMDPDRDETTAGSSGADARPTRQRKKNSKYCSDSFVSEPPPPKRLPTVRKGKVESVREAVEGMDSAVPSPGNGAAAEGVTTEPKGSNKKKRK